VEYVLNIPWWEFGRNLQPLFLLLPASNDSDQKRPVQGIPETML
jgi:hypothetical protein